MNPTLRVPFKGDFPITFAFGAVPESAVIKARYQQWGLLGHNGIDYGLTEGTEVIASDSGKIVQAGPNGDFGNSVTILHAWGKSLYGHLKEVRVGIGKEVKQDGVIGISGATGFAFGAHLHFGIKPNDADERNGYLGYIDPSGYFGNMQVKNSGKNT